MISGINGTGNAFYLANMRRAASNAATAAGSSQSDLSKSQSLSKSRLSMEEIFSKIDTDGNGLISEDEFNKAKSEAQGQITDTLAGSRTATSTSGLLNLLEASARLSSAGAAGSDGVQSQISGIVSNQVFNKLDTNGDGVVSRDELSQVMGGVSGGSNSSPNKTVAGNATAQANALMAQVINRYAQYARSGQTPAAQGNLLLTG